MIVLIVDAESRKVRGTGVSQETCDLIAQKLVAAYNEVAKLPERKLNKLYTRFLGLPEKPRGICVTYAY